MSGHNKWSKIKHKKGVTDAKKSKEFGRLVRDIKVAVREAGGNTDAPAVRLSIEKAKSVNMPKDNIDRAIKSAQGSEGENLETALYETYGPGGTALLIETVTDNKNRTGAEIKKLLSDHGLELSAPGSALWIFEKKDGVWIVKQKIDITDEDKQKLETVLAALDAHDDVQRVTLNADL